MAISIIIRPCCCNRSRGYIDPNPITHLDNNGHNYFLSENPYVLNSYAAFGEANYKSSATSN